MKTIDYQKVIDKLIEETEAYSFDWAFSINDFEHAESIINLRAFMSDLTREQRDYPRTIIWMLISLMVVYLMIEDNISARAIRDYLVDTLGIDLASIKKLGKLILNNHGETLRELYKEYFKED